MKNPESRSRFVPLPVAVLSVAAAYAAMAKVSFVFTIPPGNITPIFPAAGLALASVLIMGRSALPAVWLGSFAANIISFVDGSMPSVHAGLPNLPVGAFIGLGAMCGAAAGAFLVQRLCKDEHPLQSGRNVLILVSVGGLLCCLVSPTVGVLSLSLAGDIPWDRFGASWVTWWVGDAAGTLVAAPFFLAWQRRPSVRRNTRRIPEAAVLGGVTLLACYFVFFRSMPYEYGLLPLLLWAAFRFGMRGATTSAAVMALLATIGASRGASPFVGTTVNESLLLLNSFFGVTITCALFLAGLREERKRADGQLHRLNRALRTISECNQALIHATDETALLNQVCRLVTDIGGYRLAWVGFAEWDEARTVRPVAQAGFEDGYLEALQVTWADTERGRGPTGTAIRTGLPCAVQDIRTNPDYAPWRVEALKRGYASSLGLPLKTGDRVFGTLNISSASRDSFDAEETKLMTELADDLAYGITALRTRAQQQEAEAALRVSERKYRELVELANSIILRWTSQGTITFLNEFGLRFFGYSADEILGRHVMDTIVPTTEIDGRNLRSLMEQICADPRVFEQNINENVRRNGDRVWIAWTNKVVLDVNGGVAEILSVGTDITERKEAEEQIRQLHRELQLHAAELERRVAERTAELAVARDRAEAADRLKSAFLATMSHELRTPLNSIIGFTGIILQGLAGPLNPEQRKQLEMVRGSARHLLALINDVLDISKIEAGQLEVACEPFDLRASIEKAASSVKLLAEKKALVLQVALAPEIGAWESDQRRIEQILINLLNNAIKFTEHGRITLTAEIAGDSVRISIADTGIGIKPDDFQKLFQPFRQIDTGLARNHEGTGLGLAICRRLAELLGGEIFAESEWGRGSTFTVVLPDKGGGSP